MPARPRFEDVDPRTLHLPPGMAGGVSLVKLARQFSKYGLATAGMPPPEVSEDPGGRLVLIDGVTRATRVARYLPGRPITVRVRSANKHSVAALPTIADRLP